MDNTLSSDPEFLSIFLQNKPLLDVRAPVEFNKGAFPTSFNAPLLDDHQRKLIGTEYKQSGQEAAIALGNQLATAEIKKARLDSWNSFFASTANDQKSDAQKILYCFRGGLRSKISQQWLSTEGIEAYRVEGGYKALRIFLLQQLDSLITNIPTIVLSGRTGSGKTLVIKALNNGLDLEGIAQHRGSSFGSQLQEQPTQINFENQLAVGLLKLKHSHKVPCVVLEDEAHLIGRCALPQSVHQKIKQSPIVLLEQDHQARIEHIYQEYIVESCYCYQQAFGEQGASKLGELLLNQLARIKKRLGGARYKTAQILFSDAMHKLCSESNPINYQQCIDFLLINYYDPMYDFQLKNKKQNIVFAGNYSQVMDYLREKSNQATH